MTRSTAIQRSRIVMPGWRRALASSTSWMARPVASAAWAIRRTAWPPSRVRCRPSGPAGSGGERHALLDEPGDRLAAVLGDEARPHARRPGPAPASCVSRTCRSTLSSSPRTPTIPPWAQAVAASSKPRLASTTTGCRSASWRATVRPASPAPTITTGAREPPGAIRGGRVGGGGIRGAHPAIVGVAASTRSAVGCNAVPSGSTLPPMTSPPRLPVSPGLARPGR